MSKQSNPWAAPFDVASLSYAEAEAMAHDTGFFGNTGEPLLETVVDMLDELGRPDAAFDVIQIAGTNGKTSTSRYTAAVLAGEGLRVALYTSPELVEMRERMEVGGRPVAPEAFARGIALAAEAGVRVNARRAQEGLAPYRVTEFDLLTVAACCVFAEARVDVAVLEVGLGGRWDATTATHPVVTCVTGIGLDHTRILGDTLEAIAGEKAAIIKHGQRCVIGAGCAPQSVEDVILERCAAEGVTPVLLRSKSSEAHERAGLPCASYCVVRRPEHLGDELELSVSTPLAEYRGLRAAKPLYQAANIACAVTLAEAYLERPLNAQALRAAVAACPTPGRFAMLSTLPVQLMDAAHNPQSVRTFLDSLAAVEPEVSRRPMLLCAVLADKDVDGIVGLLAPEFPSVAVTATSSPRALPAAKLGAIFRDHGRVPAALYPTVGLAVAALKDRPFVATGSITLAGELAAYYSDGC